MTTTIVLTSGTTWTAPSDWNSACNNIECYGAASYGGGAYAKITNLSLTPGTSYPISIGAGSIGGTATDTYLVNTSTVMAKGAVGATGGQLSSSVGSVKYSGGNAGSGVSGSGTDSNGSGYSYSATGGGGSSANSTASGINGSNATTGQSSYTIAPHGGSPQTIYTTAGYPGNGATGIGPYAGTGGKGGSFNTNNGGTSRSAPTAATNYGAGGAPTAGYGSSTTGTQGLIVITYVPLPPPTISSDTPNYGNSAGGQNVVIVGSNFVSVNSVAFGTANSTFTLNSNVQITATAPAAIVSGANVITVTTPTGSATIPYTYYTAPQVLGLSRISDLTTGGMNVNITGNNFYNVSSVKFGSSPANGYSVVNSTFITSVSPGGTGMVDVKVTNDAGVSSVTSADQFTYVSSGIPAISSISPAFGTTAGGTSVTITGTNFVNVSQVQFGSANAMSFSVTNTSQIIATSPSASASLVDISVTNTIGTSNTGTSDQYSFTAVPVVTGIIPSSGLPAGGTTVTITGINFSSISAVKFGSTNAASFTVTNTSQIVAVSPSGQNDTQPDVTVINPTGTSSTTPADVFTYTTTNVSAQFLSFNFN